MRTLFEISKTGILAAERSMSVTAQNMVNVDTPGYSRQRVNATPVGMHLGIRHAGLGVNITSVSRLRNEMKEILLNENRQEMGYMQGKAKVLEQLEATMTTDSGGDLDLRIGRLFDVFSDLSSNPQDMSVRNNIISEATQLTVKLKELDRSINRTSDLVRDSVTHSVAQINNLLKDLAALNNAIKYGQASGQPDHTSLDIQVRKLEQLSELVDFDTHITGNGTLELRIGGMLVLHEDQASHFQAEIDEIHKVIRIRLDNGKSLDITTGRLGAELEMYQQGIPDARRRLDDIAATLVNEFNALHSTGYGLDGTGGRPFFDPAETTAATIQVNPQLVANQNLIAASTAPDEPGNGDLAARIADLRNQKIVGGRKIIDFTVDLISRPGGELGELRNQIEATDSKIHMLEMQQEQESGVSIDEELTLLIQYQNAYQGAARVMVAAQEMYDTLLSLTR